LAGSRCRGHESSVDGDGTSGGERTSRSRTTTATARCSRRRSNGSSWPSPVQWILAPGAVLDIAACRCAHARAFVVQETLPYGLRRVAHPELVEGLDRR